MNKFINSFIVACLALLVASCACSKKAVSSTVLNGDWSIVEVNGKPVVASGSQEQPFIGFNLAEKRIYGNSGCNRMMGALNVDSTQPGALSFGAMGSTRMACPDMLVEQSILGALNEVKSFKAVSCSKKKEGCKVALCNAEGKQVLVIEKKTEQKKEVNLSMLEGEWTIDEVGGETIPTDLDKIPFIGFDLKEMRIYGTGGCNNMNGVIKQDKVNPKSIDFQPIATTMMACPDMELEGKVLQALNEVKSFDALADGKVGLYGESGNLLATLSKK